MPPRDLADVPFDAVQFSPVVPGSASLAEATSKTLDSIVIVAPPGTIERRYILALAMRALKPGGALIALARKDKGGARLAKELEGFGCNVSEAAKSHYRICRARKPETAFALDDVIGAGGPQYVPSLGLWSQPGIFSWDRIDPGSALLAEAITSLAGRGADFGCGYGYLARHILQMANITELALIDIDRRAVDAARRNITDPRVQFLWDDVLRESVVLKDLDFVVMNPPFHAEGTENKSLGQDFLRKAADVLRTGGVLWLTANRHLPYEAILNVHFKSTERVVERDGYKVYRSIR
jgi:16S rRNA (guanine1207-N2)-methyltransferase